MLDWETASRATKVTLLVALGLMALGIVVSMIGVARDVRPTIFIGIGMMALGIVAHLVGYIVRFGEARRRLRSQTRQGARGARKG